MIYENKPLLVKILFANTYKKPIFGIYRPSAYIKESGNFCSICKFDLFKKEIEPGNDLVFNIIIESPAGYGEHLKKGALMSIRNGLDEEGRALILEIIGYVKNEKHPV
jgi:hypothetical protein